MERQIIGGQVWLHTLHNVKFLINTTLKDSISINYSFGSKVLQKGFIIGSLIVWLFKKDWNQIRFIFQLKGAFVDVLASKSGQPHRLGLLKNSSVRSIQWLTFLFQSILFDIKQVQLLIDIKLKVGW